MKKSLAATSLQQMASVNRLALEKLYRDYFQPEDYVANYYQSLDVEVEFFLRNLHHFFAVGINGEIFLFYIHVL